MASVKAHSLKFVSLALFASYMVGMVLSTVIAAIFLDTRMSNSNASTQLVSSIVVTLVVSYTLLGSAAVLLIIFDSDPRSRFQKFMSIFQAVYSSFLVVLTSLLAFIANLNRKNTEALYFEEKCAGAIAVAFVLCFASMAVLRIIKCMVTVKEEVDNSEISISRRSSFMASQKERDIELEFQIHVELNNA